MSLPRATLLDVARAANVSRTTASNAFNRPDQLSVDLRERVLGVARELGYSGPHPAARMLRTGRAGAIGIVMPEGLPYAFGDPASVAFLQGVAEICQQEKAAILVIPGMDDSTTAEIVRTAVVDGFMLYCSMEEWPVNAVLKERGLPVVAIDLDGPDWVHPVRIEDRSGARAAAEHLIELGHREIAVLSMELAPGRLFGSVRPDEIDAVGYTVTRKRLLGYLDAVRAAGLDVDSLPIEACPGDDDASAIEGALRLLAREPRPTAILAMSDRLAVGVMLAAARLGLSVPAELSVVGFDDIPLAAELSPPLTTVRQPLVEKGRQAALGLFRPLPSTCGILPTELVVRGSTARFDPNLRKA